MHSTLLSLLEEYIKKNTDRIVYRDKERDMSFSMLDEVSGKTGQFIAEKMNELFPGDPLRKPILVMTGRNVYTPACYIGIARAGCFYAPCDSSLPKSRLENIISLIEAPVLITDLENIPRVSELGYKGQVYLLEDILAGYGDKKYDREFLQNIAKKINGSDPLYVIFTSGSTGVPKGVITSHYSLMCYLDAVNEVLDLDSSDVLGNQSPLDYIAAIRDIYLPHMSGASTCVIPEKEFAMPSLLFESLRSWKITTLCWSAAGLEMAAKLGAFDLGVELSLKKVIFSGSVMSGKYLSIWQKNLPDTVFINQYGPTEATASCTYYIVNDIADEDTSLPIGKAYKHYNVFLLNIPEDEDSETHKNSEARVINTENEIGEICISGPCLALGYYNNAEKSAESFIQNPTNHSFRELIYKTGDLARYDSEGNLLFLGRRDRQIKHLGHRIELDEIELAAMKINGIKECCAMYNSAKELLYLFYEGDASAKDITLYFRANMPAFMVPRRIKQLETLPKLPNGKKDMPAIRDLM